MCGPREGEYKDLFGPTSFVLQLKETWSCFSSRRVMAVLNPLKVVITNFPSSEVGLQ